MRQLFYSHGRRIKGKKALLTSSLVDFYAIVAFIFIVLIFYLIFAIGGKSIEQRIVSSTNSLNAEATLLNFLRTPVLVDVDNDGEKEQTSVAELILLTDLDDERSENFQLLKQKANHTLNIYWQNKQAKGVELAKIYVYLNNKKFEISDGVGYLYPGESKHVAYTAEAEIPSYNGDDGKYVVRLEMYTKEFEGLGP